MHQLLKQAIELDDVSLLTKYLAETSSEPKSNEALYHACKQGKLKIAQHLIENKKANPNLIIDSLMAMDNGPIFKFAAESGNLELVKYLLEQHHVDLEAKGQYAGTQDTALSRAVGAGHYNVVRYLLSKGANPNSNISYGSVLGKGVDSGNMNIIKKLVSAGAKITWWSLKRSANFG